MKPDKPKAGRFYLLPKIHKVNKPGRPIVSANGHPTEKISKFVDFHLRLYVEALPSHLKDTTDYLQNFIRPFLFRWTLRHYTLASHKMTVSKHVERPGTKEPLYNHQRNVLSSCSPGIFNKPTEPLWEQRWLFHTPTSSWRNMKY